MERRGELLCGILRSGRWTFLKVDDQLVFASQTIELVAEHFACSKRRFFPVQSEISRQATISQQAWISTPSGSVLSRCRQPNMCWKNLKNVSIIQRFLYNSPMTSAGRFNQLVAIFRTPSLGGPEPPPLRILFFVRCCFEVIQTRLRRLKNDLHDWMRSVFQSINGNDYDLSKNKN